MESFSRNAVYGKDGSKCENIFVKLKKFGVVSFNRKKKFFFLKNSFFKTK
mgnify:CR=1 FL=1